MKDTLKNALPGAALLLCTFTFAQQIPQEKLVDWSTAGLQATLPNYDTIDISEYGFFTGGQTPNDQQMQMVLDDHPGPVVFHFPAGDYFFEKTIQLREGQVLKGASATETRFIFDLAEPGHLISIRGTADGQTMEILADVPKDSSVLMVENATLFESGDFIKIICEDAALVTSEWAEHSTGQICQVNQISGNLLTIQPALRKSLTLASQPRIVRMAPVQFAGVECISIERRDTTSQQTSNILLDRAANCWVKGVHSAYCNFGHVTVQNSAHVQVSGSYFHDAFDYGGGGKAYGVVLQFGSSDCLVENNIFKQLRHAMLLQAGPNGNVVSYNYSMQPFWTGTNLPPNAAGDLVLHGNYPYSNLFEGNIVQNIVIDDSHGANGPGNVFFRNRAEMYGIFMNNNPPSDGQLFIGNEVTGNLPFTGFYLLNGTGHFEFGNNVKNTVTPANTGNLTISSLYLAGEPAYFQELALEVGIIGLPNPANSGTIPARARFLAGEMTVCEMIPPIVSGSGEAFQGEKDWKIFPNPTTGILKIHLKKASLEAPEIFILDPAGKVIERAFLNEVGEISLARLSPGLYFVMVKNGGQRICEKVVVMGR
jgi:hypothetical protein